MNEKLQQCGVQLPLPNQCVSDDIISQAESHYRAQGFKPQKSKGSSTTVGGTDHLVPVCEVRTSLSRQKGLKCSKPTRHEAWGGSFLFKHWFLLQKLWMFTSRMLKSDSSGQRSGSRWNSTRGDLHLTAWCTMIDMLLKAQWVLCNSCHLYNICGGKWGLKFDFLWRFFMVFLGFSAPSLLRKGCTDEWHIVNGDYPRPLCLCFQVINDYRSGSILSWTCVQWTYVMCLLLGYNTENCTRKINTAPAWSYASHISKCLHRLWG